MQKKSKIIRISEFNAEKRKDKELIYYNEQLSKLNLRLSIIMAEIKLTKEIIDMIENEKLMDFAKRLNQDTEQILIESSLPLTFIVPINFLL